MNKHTPGPWNINWNGGMAPIILGEARRGETREIAHVWFHDGSEDPEVHANARLIAAAPDMLDALKCAKGNADRHVNSRRKWSAHDQKTWEIISAAIAKAEDTEQ